MELKDDQSVDLWVDKIFGAARATAVYSEPVTAGVYTVITASEVTAGGGFGGGQGFGPTETAGDTAQGHKASAGGGGSGGGGGSSGRPVAAIVIGPRGVEVKPVFDVTKFGLAALTAWAAMLGTAMKLRQRRS